MPTYSVQCDHEGCRFSQDVSIGQELSRWQPTFEVHEFVPKKKLHPFLEKLRKLSPLAPDRGTHDVVVTEERWPGEKLEEVYAQHWREAHQLKGQPPMHRWVKV